MGNFASRIHSSKDDKLYNVLPMGDMPTVVFQRIIRPNSVPGMQYYFSDGQVKWKDEDAQPGYSSTNGLDEAGGCIFTVPEDFDFSKMSANDPTYVREHTRSAKNANLNTTSPNYIIRNGEVICIKTLIVRNAESDDHESKPYRVLEILNDDAKYIIRYFRNCGRLKGDDEPGMGYKNTGCGGRRFRNRMCHENGKIDTHDNSTAIHSLPNQMTIIPVGRDKRFKSIFHYKLRRLENGYSNKYRTLWLDM